MKILAVEEANLHHEQNKQVSQKLSILPFLLPALLYMELMAKLSFKLSYHILASIAHTQLWFRVLS